MIKEKLILLGNKANIVNIPQSTIDSYKVEDEEKEIFLHSVKLFSSKAKSHITYPFVMANIKNEMKFFDIVRIKEHPLPSMFNKSTKRVLLNLTPFGRKKIQNMNVRDLYTLTVYSHFVAYYSSVVKFPLRYSEIVSEYMSSMFLKTFAKKYGLVGSYVDLIPELRYLVSVYIQTSFFGIAQKIAYKNAVKTSRFNPKDIEINLDDYDFLNAKSFIKSLSDSGVLPGMNTYLFISIMMASVGSVSIPMFEDLMRFCSTMVASTVSGNTIFTPRLQGYSPDLYNSIVSAVIKSI